MLTHFLKKFLLGLVGTVIIAVAISLFTAATAGVRFYYSITDLGPGQAYGINDSGQVAGVFYPNEAVAHAFKWQNATMIDLGTLGGNSSQALDINNKGQVVGSSDTKKGDNVVHAFLWEKGQMTDLGILPSSYNYSQAYGINDAGQVVGFSGKPGPSSGADVPRAFLWENGRMTDLSICSDSSCYSLSLALGINNKGQVVGTSHYDSNKPSHALLWDKGKTIDLGSFGNYSFAYDINDRGQVVGHSDTKAGTSHAFKWQNGKMTDLDSLGSFIMSFAYSINKAGQVVGSAFTSNSFHAFLWENGRMTDLNSLLPPKSGWILTEAWDVNNRGQIVGYGQFNGNPNEAFLLTPTRVIQ